MKLNTRVSRYYDLKKNEGYYASAGSLCGWWTFSPEDKDKASLSGKNIDAAAISGSYIAEGVPVDIDPALLETPSFLKGINFVSLASLAVKNTPPGSIWSGFDISNFPVGTQAMSDMFTLSITFKLVQNWPLQGTDSKVCIAQLSDVNRTAGRFALIYDNDAGHGGEPAVSIQAFNNAGDANRQWNAGQHPHNAKSWQTRQQVRDWIRLDLVVKDPSFTNLASTHKWANNNGAAIYINGSRVTTDDSGSSLPGTVTPQIITNILVGGLTSQFAAINSGIRNDIQVGEIAFWNTALSEEEIGYLYNTTQSSYSSGILNNPTETGRLCGECEHDAYPTISRSGDHRRKGIKSIVFDANSSVLTLPIAGEQINYPTLLISGAEANWAVGRLIATPNTLPTIYAPASASNQGYSNIINSYNRCIESTDSSDIYGPFNDSRAPTNVATEVGQLSQIAPGWSTNLGNRIIIDIDITPSEPAVLRVLTGSSIGETFGSSVGDDLPNFDTTGLSYFNFNTMKYEPMGGRNSETGAIFRWTLPEEISSSFTMNYPGNFTAPTHGALDIALTQCRKLSDFELVPRIFQPYGSLISHRSTFNHVHATTFNTFNYMRGRSMWMGMQDNLPIQAWTVYSRSLGASADFPFTTNFPDPMDAGAQSCRGFGGRINTEAEWLPFTDDIPGYRWDGRYIKKAGIMWNDPGEVSLYSSGSPDLANAFNKTLESIGRPIAYSAWSTNSMFHASSSQTIKMSDYITEPFVLEAFEVLADVKAARLQEPYLKDVPIVGSANSRAVMWSNTNNHIDCLTYFLLRQENPDKGSANLVKRSGSSKRDLVGYSNNVFSSQYVGWDVSNHSLLEVDHTLHNTSPMNGPRASRIFKVARNLIEEHVDGLDSLTYYSNSNGTDQPPYGPGGVFFKNDGGVSDIGQPGNMDTDPNLQPTRKFVTASHRIHGPVPIRVSNAYAQHSTPIFPQCAGQWTDPGMFTALQKNRYFDSINGIGWQNRGMFLTNTNQRKITPRMALACMGTYWPGGVSISMQKKRAAGIYDFISSSFSVSTELDGFTGTLALLGPSGTMGVDGGYREYDDLVPPVLAAAYESSVRSIRVGGGLSNNRSELIGGAPSKLKAGLPSQGEGFTPTTMKAAYEQNGHLSNERWLFNAPYFMHYGLSGSRSENSAYVLLPDDEIIFGAQWSPADAAHRSFKEISFASNQLSYADQDPAAGIVPPAHQTGSFSVSPYIQTPMAGNPACRNNILASEVGNQAYRYVGYCTTNDLTMNASASCTIQDTTSVLRLYGTLVRDQVQKYHSLPQQLTNLCVHEVIGNQVIVDEYDIGSTHVLKSSTSGKLVSGSSMRTAIESQWYGTPSQSPSLPSPIYNLGRGVRRSAADGNLVDLGTINRSARLSDVSEYYYDSLCPDIAEMWVVDDAQPFSTNEFFGLRVNTGAGSNYYQDRTSLFAVSLPEFGPPSGVTANTKFARSFPFEPRYSECKRMTAQTRKPAYHMRTTEHLTMYSSSMNAGGVDAVVGFAYANTNTVSLTAAGPSHFCGGEVVLGVATEGPQTTRPMVYVAELAQNSDETQMAPGTVRGDFPRGNAVAGLVSTSRNHIKTNFEMSGSSLTPFFGIGDNRHGVLDSYYYYLESNSPVASTTGKIYAAKLVSRKPRGYRYGLISDELKPISAVFRRDRYGQFRDMLEQRQYSALFINDPTDIAQSKIHAGESAQHNIYFPGSITAEFRQAVYLNPTASPTEVSTSPANTNSSNLSIFASSSLPFFDGETKNRDGAPPLEEVIIT